MGFKMKNKNFNLSKFNFILITTIGLITFNYSYSQIKTDFSISNKEMEKPKEYQGKTLDKIKNSGKIVIGVRTSSLPISYTNNFKEDGKPMGYALDICNIIVNKYKEKYSLQGIQTQYVFVNPKNRIPLVKDGTVDLECGSTTNNENRRKDVTFSIPYYIASTKIITLSKRTDLQDLYSLRGKSIAYIKGSTMDNTITEYNNNRNLQLKKVEVTTPEEALTKLSEGVVDSFAYDDLIIYGLRANSANPSDYKILSDSLSIEPESIMMRKNDKEFSNFVDEELKNLIKTGQIQELYNKWFLNPIPPKNITLGLQQSNLLKDVFRFPTTIVGN
jgi:glutamate/aspartate transport system substrate-binding protein